MKKILILSLLALPVLATAEVHFYGDLKSGVEASNTQYGSHRISNNGVSDMGSYVGMRGSHPIGGSNNVLWQVEQDAPLGKADAKDTWRSRSQGSGETYIGFGR